MVRLGPYLFLDHTVMADDGWVAPGTAASDSERHPWSQPQSVSSLVRTSAVGYHMNGPPPLPGGGPLSTANLRQPSRQPDPGQPEPAPRRRYRRRPDLRELADLDRRQATATLGGTAGAMTTRLPGPARTRKSLAKLHRASQRP